MAKTRVSIRFLFLSVLGLLAVACSPGDDHRSKVVVSLQLGAGVSPPETVHVSATQGPVEVKSFDVGWGDAGAGPDQIGVFFPDGVSGQVVITAKAYKGRQPTAEGQTAPVTLKKGESVGPIVLVLDPVSNAGQDGGVKDGGVDRGASETGSKDAEGTADATAPNPSPDGEPADAESTDAGASEAAIDPMVDAPIGGPDGAVAGDTGRPSDTSSAVDGAKDSPTSADGPPTTDAIVRLGDTPPLVDTLVRNDAFLPVDAHVPSDSAAPADAPLIMADTNLPDAYQADAPDAATPPVDAANATDGAHALAWEPATNIQNDTLNGCYNTAVAVDPVNEHVYVAWNEDTKVKVRRWNRQTATWEAIIVLQDGGNPFAPVISADALGNVMVLWPQSDAGSSNGVWMSRTANGTSWSAPQTITTDPSNNIAFALARNGTGHAAYTKYKDSQYDLHTAYYDGANWTENSSAVESDIKAWDASAQIALGASGDGLLIFAKEAWSLAGTALSGTIFSPPVTLDPNTGITTAHDPTLAVNRKGEGIVVWTEVPNNTVALARSYDPSATPSARWGAVTQLATAPTIATPAVALDEQGTITLIWQQETQPSGLLNLVAKRGTLSGTWGEVVTLEADNKASTLADYAYPKAVIDGDGNVLVVWRKDRSEGANSTTGAYGTRYMVATNTWLPEAQLAQKTGFDVASPSLAVSDSGLGAASFSLYTGAALSDPDSYNALVSFLR